MSVFVQILKACLTILTGGDKQDQNQGGQAQPPQQQQPHQGGGGGGGAWQTQPQHHQQQPSYPPHQQQQQHGGGQQHHAGGGGGGQPHKYQGRMDANQQNQADPHYTGLRDKARREGDQMAHCFDESHRAYESGDGARAKELSNEGKAHKAEMERLNKEASDWIYYQNNTDSAVDEVDLHGLYVAEAVSRTETAIQQAQAQGKTHLNIIVGKGLHSQGHVAKLKPAIEELMQKYNLAAELDPQNAGVLIVHLGQGGQRGRGMGSDEITRRLDNDNENCIIM